MDVISVPGRLVRDPVTRRAVDQTPVSIDPTDPSWSRLLADGDVIEARQDHIDPLAPAAEVEKPADAEQTPAHSTAAEHQEHAA